MFTQTLHECAKQKAENAKNVKNVKMFATFLAVLRVEIPRYRCVRTTVGKL